MSASPFQHRGVIEGFYGTPWAHEDRLHAIRELGACGMNRYVYAPKDDPLHRARWREPYPEEFLRRFSELLDAGARAGVEVGFAISPGLSIRYSAADDVHALCEKLARFRALGVRFFGLCLDDVPSSLAHAEDRAAFASLAAAHVSLAHALRDRLGEQATLWLVPTDYLGSGPTDYLEELGLSLAPEIEVGWTGRTVCSPTIELSEARARAATPRWFVRSSSGPCVHASIVLSHGVNSRIQRWHRRPTSGRREARKSRWRWRSRPPPALLMNDEGSIGTAGAPGRAR